MSLQFLLDGYNIVHQMPTLAQKKLEEAREGLIRLIELHHPQGSQSNSVTVVFDGQKDVWGAPLSSSIKVVFTKGESADDLIKRMVTEAANQKQLVVVSNDRNIKYYVRSMGAKVISVEEFIDKLKPRKQQSHKPRKSPGVTNNKKRISTTDEYSITKEMSKIWLNKQKKKRS